MEQNRALILMYHRVAEVRSDPWSLCVSPQHFAEQLEILQETARPLSLRQLTDGLHRGGIPSRSVVITFDDGYVDNLQHAAPLLERFDAPATVFIAAGCLGWDREFWWDELERILLHSGNVPDALCLIIQGHEYAWSLGGQQEVDPVVRHEYPNWRAWEAGPTRRHSLYYALWQRLQPLCEDERRSVIKELHVWAGDVLPERPAHRVLQPEELVKLAHHEQIEIGAHTMTHPLLSSLPEALQGDEILQSKKVLEEILDTPVTSFAYPYGDFATSTPGIVREAGFARACSTIAGRVEPGVDDYVLPRIAVEDWDGEEFRERLAARFDGAPGDPVQG